MTLTLDVLDRLVRFDTVSARSNLDLIEYVEDFLKARGFRLLRLPDSTGEKAGLYAEIGPGGDGILLSAHTDVVPVDGQIWTRAPFHLTREGDRLFGRGTTDMKGYVACLLALADRAARATLKAPLKIVLSYDEEVGCVGLQQMQDRLAPMLGRPHAAFVGEPTGMQVAVGHKGKVALRAVCKGETGHSALAPRFTNALHLAADLVCELRRLQDDLAANGARDAAYDIPYSTVHVGKFIGGTALNIVPDEAELSFEIRHLASEPVDNIVAHIEAAAREIEADFSARGTVSIILDNAYPGLEVAPDAAVVGQAQRLARNNNVIKVAFGTEAGIFDKLGIPTLVCGPGSMEGQGHKPDEFITIDQLVACDAMMDRILEDLTQ